MSMTQIFPLFKTSLTDSMLVPYRFPLYSPYSRNLQTGGDDARFKSPNRWCSDVNSVVPVVVHHVVEDLPAGEAIFSARLLVSFGSSRGVWVEKSHQMLGCEAAARCFRLYFQKTTYEARRPGRRWGSSQSNASEVHSRRHQTGLREDTPRLITTSRDQEFFSA